MPHLPSRIAAKVEGTSLPRALIVPAPVITTRFIPCRSSQSAAWRRTASFTFLYQFLHRRDDSRHRSNVKITFAGVIGIERNRDIKGLFDGKNALDQTQTIDPQILQRVIEPDIRRLKHRLFGND